MRLGERGVAGESVAEATDGGDQVAAAARDHAEQVKCGRLLGVAVQDLAAQSLCFGMPTGAMVFESGL